MKFDFMVFDHMDGLTLYFRSTRNGNWYYFDLLLRHLWGGNLYFGWFPFKSKHIKGL